jgi:exodeoxyribonuclease VII small subunit
MAEDRKQADVASMSFEDALAELKAIVTKLEKGEGRLEEAVADYERGTALKTHCERKLSEAQAKLEKIVAAESGVATEPIPDA